MRKADFVHVPGAAFPSWWRAGPAELPLVTGWAGGPAASKLGKGDPLPEEEKKDKDKTGSEQVWPLRP